MSKNSKDESHGSNQAKRARTSKTVSRCYDCEQVYQPISKEHKFCTKCSADKPINAVAVDQSNLGNKKSQSSLSLRKPSVWKLEPIKLVPKNQPGILSVPNGSLLIDLAGTNLRSAIPHINLPMETAKRTLTGIRTKEVDAVQVIKNISSSSTTLGSETPTTCAIGKSSSATAVRKSTDSIPLAVIDLSTSSCDESNNDEDENQVICMENAISSQIASFKNEAGDSCPSEFHQLTQLSKTDLCRSMPPSKSSGSGEKPSTELLDNPEHLTIRNVPQHVSNHMLDFSTLELDDLRVKEVELKTMLIPYQLDYDEISSVQKRITELESRHSAEKEMLFDKEGVVKSFELKVVQSQCVVEAFAEERDSLRNHIKEAGAAVELARSSCDSTEMGVNEIKRKLEESKDEVVKNYLITILAKKEERAKDAEAKAKYTVSQLEEAEKDLKKTEGDLKSKEAVHHEMLLQGEKLKSELMALHDTCNSTDEEVKRAHSQLESLLQGNNLENFCKYFELKEQLLEIQCKIECSEHERKLEKERLEFQQSLEIKLVLKKKDLDAEREKRSQMLSLSP
ncbi:ankyrin repeat domain-containing protein 26-like isoform X2 [Daphnia pulex]|uniref:ankyrin repeat domain-containing protein 26-like isoform X2 n=1 Tax=Daphnia pulex TaxID=6669 RepID=UPI001EDE2D62|nr:ankyrin repeat domain-containing protein 26-like isoform X2 [Daphnia pulex]